MPLPQALLQQQQQLPTQLLLNTTIDSADNVLLLLLHPRRLQSNVVVVVVEDADLAHVRVDVQLQLPVLEKSARMTTPHPTKISMILHLQIPQLQMILPTQKTATLHRLQLLLDVADEAAAKKQLQLEVVHVVLVLVLPGGEEEEEPR